MTLILAYGLPITGQRFSCSAGFVASDSIVTSTIPIQAFDRTSQGQIVHPTTVASGHGDVGVNYFAEAGCKVGVLNDKSLLAASGDYGLIQDILQVLYGYSGEISSTDNLPWVGENICTSLNPCLKPVGTRASFLVLIHHDSLCTISSLDFIVEPAGLKWKGQWMFASEGSPSQWRGKGSELLRGCPLSFHLQSELRRNPDMMHYAIQIELSEAVMKIGHNSACHGVGGAFFTIGIIDGAPSYPLDYVYVMADANGDAKVLTKLIYREGHFYVMDFINRVCRVMQTLDTLQLHLSGTDTSECIKESYLNEAVAFRSQVVVINSKDSERKSHIDIRGSAEKPALAAGEDLHNKQLKGGVLTLNLCDNAGSVEKSFAFKIRG